MNTLVISAFPGTGKSYCFKNNKEYKILDSDSSKFDKKHFPQNYIEHIKNNMGKADIIFVSSHEEVRNALVEAGIDFILIYPRPHLKDEYIKRYKDRGNDQAFIDLLDKNWNNWIQKLEHNRSIVLNSNEFISDVIGLLLN